MISLLFADLYSLLNSAHHRSLLIVVDLCLFIVNLCSLSATSLARLRVHRLHLSSLISLFPVTQSLYSFAATSIGRLCLWFTSIANIAHSPSLVQIYDYLSLSGSSSQVQSLYSLLFWVCRSIILFGFVDLLFGFVDLFIGFVVVDLLNHWFCSLALCLMFVFSVEIKADRCPLEPDLTRLVVFHKWRRFWNFSTPLNLIGLVASWAQTRPEPTRG